jgi:hypothetical protein
MDGLARDRRLGSVQRSYVPTRLSDDSLADAYYHVLQVRPPEQTSEALGVDMPTSESSHLVLTGGQYV